MWYGVNCQLKTKLDERLPRGMVTAGQLVYRYSYNLKTFGRGASGYIEMAVWKKLKAKFVLKGSSLHKETTSHGAKNQQDIGPRH